MGRLLLTLLLPLLLTTSACVKRLHDATPKADPKKTKLQAAEVMRIALAAETPALQYAAANYLVQLPIETLSDPALGDTTLGDALLGRLTAGDTTLQTRQWLIDLLAESDYWKSLDQLAKDAKLAWALEDRAAPEMEAREVAIYALFKLGGPTHLKDMIPAITDQERTVRAIAAEAFGKLGDGTEWSTLQRFAEDENEFVRLRAAKSLAMWIARHGTELDGDEAKAVLDPLLADEDPHVRLMAKQAKGIALMNDPREYRLTIYSPLLTGRTPDAEGDAEEWGAFRDVALGQFEWSLGYNLPVPSEVSSLVFEFLWEDHPELQHDILAAVARGARPGDTGFLQTAWASGDPGLQKKSLDLMTELLLDEGELGEEFDDTIREIGESDLVNLDAPVRTAVVRFILALARSRTIARFTSEETLAWKEAVTTLYYSPRDSVRLLLPSLNPSHPWFGEAAKGRFAEDEQLRPTMPRLHRMVWFAENPERIDPKTGVLDPKSADPLTADELEQLWRWRVMPPLGILAPHLESESDAPSIAAIRAAALVLRGEVASADADPLKRSTQEDWVDPEPGPSLPPDSEFGRGT